MTPPESDDFKTRVNGEAMRISSNAELQAGQTVGGRYEIVSLLGRGGMGLVYKAKQIFLNKEFALKTIEKRSMTETAVRRFQQEARATFELKHPGIIAVNDFGVLDDQTPFLVMELIDGETLGDCLKRRVRLSLDEAIPIFVQVCFALAYAHEHGIVHRDIKPNNIMILNGLSPGSEGSVKVLDFGIAKFLNHEGGEIQALTRTGEIFGSPLYMSPEQCSGASGVDHRSDIYSLGCVFFETLTGASPFLGENALLTMMKHQNEAALTLKQGSLGENFPREIETIVSKMLTKAPEERYQNFAQVANDLGAMRHGAPISTTANYAQSHPVKSFSGKNIFIPILLGLMVFAVLALYLEGHRLSQSLSKTEPPDKSAQTDRDSALPAKSLAVETLPKKPIAELSLSEAQSHKQPWILDFQEQASLGSLTLAPLTSREAKGKVVIDPAKPLNLAPSSYLCDRPKLFRLFRPDEIAELHFHLSYDEVSDDVLFAISHLTGITYLEFNKCDISDEGLRFLSKLSHLKELEVSSSGATGKGLNFLNLKELRLLKADRLRNTSGLSAKLANCENLTELNLSYDNLENDDLSNLGKCSKLEILHISNNNGITDMGVSKLTGLKALKELDLTDCNLTEKSIKFFQKMHLKILSITPKGWSKEAVKKLHSFFLTPSGDDNGSLRVPKAYEYLMP